MEQTTTQEQQMTTSDDFLTIAKRSLKKNTELTGQELEDEALSLAYALSATANMRIEENS
jgi:hypothetical protein